MPLIKLSNAVIQIEARSDQGLSVLGVGAGIKTDSRQINNVVILLQIVESVAGIFRPMVGGLPDRWGQLFDNSA